MTTIGSRVAVQLLRRGEPLTAVYAGRQDGTTPRITGGIVNTHKPCPAVPWADEVEGEEWLRRPKRNTGLCLHVWGIATILSGVVAS